MAKKQKPSIDRKWAVIPTVGGKRDDRGQHYFIMRRHPKGPGGDGMPIAAGYEKWGPGLTNLRLIVRAVNTRPALLAVVASAQRLMDAIAEDLPCECHGKPDAIYEIGETCPPCDLRNALKGARRA